MLYYILYIYILYYFCLTITLPSNHQYYYHHLATAPYLPIYLVFLFLFFLPQYFLFYSIVLYFIVFKYTGCYDDLISLRG